MGEVVDLAVVGGGPAGLAAASAARRAGIARVVVLDREPTAGGIPRHCAHSPFGMREFGRVLLGPAYARRLVDRAERDGVEIRPGTSVVRLGPGGELTMATVQGVRSLAARRVVLATGARETPRAARLISGDRTAGILTTGALQGFVHLERLLPFRRPAIVGTELVAFSAVLTALAHGIRPAAMLEANPQPTARWPCTLLPRLAGIPVLYSVRIVDIVGRAQVEAVVIETRAGERRIACDGIVFTGQFVPAAELVRQSHLAFDAASGGPVVDQFGRCSDPAYFAAGNILRAVETAGWSWSEGDRVGRDVAHDLAGALPASDHPIGVAAGEAIKYAVPQRLVPGALDGGLGALQLRASRSIKGRLTLSSEGTVRWTQPIVTRPERRILIPLAALALPKGVNRVAVGIEEH